MNSIIISSRNQLKFLITSVRYQSNDQSPFYEKNVILFESRTKMKDLLQSPNRYTKNGKFYGDHRRKINFNSLIKTEQREQKKFDIDINDIKYQIITCPTESTGGCHPITGRRQYHRVQKGLPREYYWIDYKRGGPTSGPPLMERVLKIIRPLIISSSIALVAHGDHQRYILATENLKVNDVICSSGILPRDTIRANECDSWPIAALPIGTIINNIEATPGDGGVYCRSAGTAATYTRRIGDRCIVKLPSKLEISVNEKCIVTVGRLSNTEHNEHKFSGWGEKARLMGRRPRSGLEQKKTGRFGRMNHPPKPIKMINGIPTVEEQKKSKPMNFFPHVKPFKF
ncbi:hypothetical protein SNEBB_000124 [Seison nebaliae]|nr:hypothetical protein SNEBB_000124 [Seison nebaliae]